MHVCTFQHVSHNTETQISECVNKHTQPEAFYRKQHFKTPNKSLILTHESSQPTRTGSVLKPIHHHLLPPTHACKEAGKIREQLRKQSHSHRNKHDDTLSLTRSRGQTGDMKPFREDRAEANQDRAKMETMLYIQRSASNSWLLPCLDSSCFCPCSIIMFNRAVTACMGLRGRGT